MSYANLQINNKVRFSTYSPAILGATFSNMKVESQMSYTAAIRQRDVINTHNSIYSSLPTGTPTDPKLLTYFEFLDVNGNNNVVLAKEWIRGDSVEIITNVGCLIEIPSMANADFERISLALKNLGITVFDIKPLN